MYIMFSNIFSYAIIDFIFLLLYLKHLPFIFICSTNYVCCYAPKYQDNVCENFLAMNQILIPTWQEREKSYFTNCQTIPLSYLWSKHFKDFTLSNVRICLFYVTVNWIPLGFVLLFLQNKQSGNVTLGSGTIFGHF